MVICFSGASHLYCPLPCFIVPAAQIFWEGANPKRPGTKHRYEHYGDPVNQSKAKAQTVTWRQIPAWQCDNKYIWAAIDPEGGGVRGIYGDPYSMTLFHNKTCNVYTHLIGNLLVPVLATVFLRYLAGRQSFNVSSMDYAMFGIYFWCAEVCLIFSAFYHLVQPYPHHVDLFWHEMDLLRIIIVTVGTLTSGIYFVFFC